MPICFGLHMKALLFALACYNISDRKGKKKSLDAVIQSITISLFCCVHHVMILPWSLSGFCVQQDVRLSVLYTLAPSSLLSVYDVFLYLFCAVSALWKPLPHDFCWFNRIHTVMPMLKYHVLFLKKNLFGAR